jgi:hypothetical protein
VVRERFRRWLVAYRRELALREKLEREHGIPAGPACDLARALTAAQPDMVNPVLAGEVLYEYFASGGRADVGDTIRRWLLENAEG